MTAYEFMSTNPWLTFFLACLATSVVIWPFKLVNRWIRHRNIVAAGWPPAHLDADGDFLKGDEK
ncbi:hypothetical protein TA3x_000401 [Tundrisphaera sp. TA3]|uniref:hypothetical protein n=1 Tax=Tundrisphaera sp. TA3 TaxID=3435775 RepID=UPI003EB8290B